MKKNRILVIGLLIILMVVVTGCGTSTINDNTPVINAIGVGKVTAQPDTFEVRISIVSKGADESVQTKNAEKAEQVIEGLKEIGISEDEIETTAVNYTPITTYDNKQGPKTVGYRAENTLRIKSKKTDLAGKLADIAIKNGAEMLGSLRFSLSDEGTDNILAEAIEKAVQDARTQAEAAAKAAGSRIVGIKNITVQKGGGSGPIFFDERANLMAKQVETPVIPGDTEYIVTVNAAFLIK